MYVLDSSYPVDGKEGERFFEAEGRLRQIFNRASNVVSVSGIRAGRPARRHTLRAGRWGEGADGAQHMPACQRPHAAALAQDCLPTRLGRRRLTPGRWRGPASTARPAA